MEHEQLAPKIARQDERRLIQRAIKATRADFPNPERHGCPERAVLEATTRRRPLGPASEDIIDHIATCAACFDEYTRIRRRHRLQLLSRIALASAAALVLAIAISWRIGPTLVSPRRPVTTKPSEPTLRTTLDFREWTAERSGETLSPQHLEVPHLKRGLIALTVKLPIGFEDGIYLLEVRNRLHETAITASGTAKWDGRGEILTSTVDLRRLVPGEYRLAVGKADSSLAEYPIQLE
jgi:hypothetical protein